MKKPLPLDEDFITCKDCFGRLLMPDLALLIIHTIQDELIFCHTLTQ